MNSRRHVYTHLLEPRDVGRLYPLLKRHWSILDRLGLLERPPACYQAEWGSVIAISEALPYRSTKAAEASLRDAEVQEVRREMASLAKRRICSPVARHVLGEPCTHLVELVECAD